MQQCPDTMVILLRLAQQKELNHLVAKTNFTEVARIPVQLGQLWATGVSAGRHRVTPNIFMLVSCKNINAATTYRASCPPGSPSFSTKLKHFRCSFQKKT